MNVIWYDEAVNDLEDIYNFYLIKSVKVAINIYNSVLKETEILKTQPYIAAKEINIKSNDFELRSLVTKNGLFKVIYYIDTGNVIITRVWCCRADPQNMK